MGLVPTLGVEGYVLSSVLYQTPDVVGGLAVPDKVDASSIRLQGRQVSEGFVNFGATGWRYISVVIIGVRWAVDKRPPAFRARTVSSTTSRTISRAGRTLATSPQVLLTHVDTSSLLSSPSSSTPA